MCGRFTLRANLQIVSEFFDLVGGQPKLDLRPRLNVSPTQEVPGVRINAAGDRELTWFRWGLIPSWARDPKIAASLINARSETVATKPSFRSAFKRRRCMVPADGFYEWQKRGSKKHPYHIRRKDGGMLAFAGLWEHWETPDGLPVETCSLLTTSANRVVAPVHDRMPVFLDKKDFALWLDPAVQDAERLTPLLVPAPAEEFEALEVDHELNVTLISKRRDLLPGEEARDPAIRV